MFGLSRADEHDGSVLGGRVRGGGLYVGRTFGEARFGRPEGLFCVVVDV